MLRRIILAGLVLGLASCCWAWRGKCVGVTDGDTITVMHQGRGERIRLYGIDAPESRQAFGTASKRAMSSYAFGKVLTITPTGKDRYRRTLAWVQAPDKSLVNQSMVLWGYAWWYRQYAPNDRTLWSLQHQAWQARRGLWSDPHPIPPWEYRHPAHR